MKCVPDLEFVPPSLRMRDVSLPGDSCHCQFILAIGVVQQTFMISPSDRSRSPRRPPFRAALTHFDAFAGMGIPKLAVHQAVSQLWNEGIELSWLESYTYEIDATAIKLGQLLDATLAKPSNHINHEAKPIDQFVLDTQQRENRATQIATMFEMVPCPVPLWFQQINHAMGPAIRLHTLGTGMAARDRDYYVQPDCSTSLESPQTMQPRPTQPPGITQHLTHFADGCRWPAFPDMSDQEPPTIRAIYPHLLQLQHEGNLTSSSDMQTLRKFMLFDINLGRTRYAGPQHLGQWLGLSHRHLAVIAANFLCEQPETCGVSILCPTCRPVAECMGRAWNLSSAARILRSLLREAVRSARQIPDCNHIALFTSGSPCTQISRGIFMRASKQADLEPVGPHAFPSNLMWQWQEGVINYSQEIFYSRRIVTQFLHKNIHSCRDGCKHAITLKAAKLVKS